MSLMSLLVLDTCRQHVYLKDYCRLADIELFNHLDELLFLFESFEHFALLICYTNCILFLNMNYILALNYGCSVLIFFNFVSRHLSFSLSIIEYVQCSLVSSLLILFLLLPSGHLPAQS